MGTSAHQSEWVCKQCGENCPSTFDACWNCGADIHGCPDVTFESRRERQWTWGDESQIYEPLYSPPQWTLGQMLWGMTVLALYLAALTQLPPALGMLGVLLWMALAPYRYKIAQRLAHEHHRGKYRGTSESPAELSDTLDTPTNPQDQP